MHYCSINSAPPIFTAEVIARSLPKYKKRGNHQYMACCPAHDDESPSLSITEGQNGKVLLHCFAGCPPNNVINTLRVMGLWRYNRPSDYVNTQALRQEVKHNIMLIDIALHDTTTGNYQTWTSKDIADVLKAVIRLGELRALINARSAING